jgi:hypothetical protein
MPAADGCDRCHARAFEVLAEAQALLVRSDERYYEAALYRLEGEAHLQLDPSALCERPRKRAHRLRAA